jgi:DNA-binding transcriptional LysR family regulator
METNRLKQFGVIVETGNLRKAAELLGVSHSGLSKSIHALEEETGLKLLLPSGRGIAITDEGMALHRRCAGFFAELDRLLGKPESKRANVIRIGSFEVFTSYFAGRLMRDYLPGCEAEIHELIPGKLEEALLLNQVDIGITYEPIPRSGIEYVQATTIEMGAYATLGRFQEMEIEKIPFVIPVQPLEGTPSGVRGRDGWPDERLKRTAPYRVDLMTTGLELVRQGTCAIFIPKFVAALFNAETKPEQRLHAIPLQKKFGLIKRKVYIVKRSGTEESKAIRQIAKALRILCSAGNPHSR